ncbi:two-component system sensor histidine kinase NtrB [Desulfosarcina ovata]|uniref:histidine kinase n=1 Tax=Desulfosarcina ovata subsp. ovata TaxID=2752305 RepID=A0A5K8A4S3_9BACT|nr:ATP-binding protein [Desulfosarcina ovata]BBO87290.1 hypothetical protein DSCOOX_04700 [Desulfosarcina ovata subsp. ovata]
MLKPFHKVGERMHPSHNPGNKFDRLRRQAEKLIQRNQQQDIHSPEDLLELIHELRIHQVELEIQNEELKRAQQELSDLHQAYERLYEFAPCGYVTLNPLGIITRVNLTGVILLSAPKPSLLGSAMSHYIATGWQDTFWDTCHTAARTGEKQRLEMQLKSRSDPPFWARADITADRDENGVAVQWRVVLTDISREKEIEEEKQQMAENLHQIQKMETLGTLAGGVAHDFNNILAIILGNYELINAKISEESPLKNKLERIRLAATRAKEVVRQLLTFARKDDIRQAVLNIADVVRETLPLIRSILPANITIQEHLASDIAPIFGNSTQIHQIIINLCTNAADAMLPMGGQIIVKVGNITLDKAAAGRHARLQPGSYVKLVVADTGCGMDANTRERIFDPYYTTKPFGKGTGIGLAVVHGIVEQHNGEIAVESNVDQGTIFTVFFPAFSGPVPDREKRPTNVGAGLYHGRSG